MTTKPDKWEPYRLFELARDKNHRLVYRQRQPLIDASGAVCGFGDMLPWEVVKMFQVLPDEPTKVVEHEALK